MKKSLLIICLCVFQAACAAQPVGTDSGLSLLSFNDLANEITVGYRDISTERASGADNDEPADTP